MNIRQRFLVSFVAMAAVVAVAVVPSASAASVSRDVHLSNGCQMHIHNSYTPGAAGVSISQERTSCSQVSTYFSYVINGEDRFSKQETESSYAESVAPQVDFVKVSMHRGINNNYWSTVSMTY